MCFRLRGSDEVNQKLLSSINESGKLHMVPASVNDTYVIRFCVCAQNATDDDIGLSRQALGKYWKPFLSNRCFLLSEYAWKVIKKEASEVMERMKIKVCECLRHGL